MNGEVKGKTCVATLFLNEVELKCGIFENEFITSGSGCPQVFFQSGPKLCCVWMLLGLKGDLKHFWSVRTLGLALMNICTTNTWKNTQCNLTFNFCHLFYLILPEWFILHLSVNIHLSCQQYSLLPLNKQPHYFSSYTLLQLHCAVHSTAQCMQASTVSFVLLIMLTHIYLNTFEFCARNAGPTTNIEKQHKATIPQNVNTVNDYCNKLARNIKYGIFLLQKPRLRFHKSNSPTMLNSPERIYHQHSRLNEFFTMVLRLE